MRTVSLNGCPVRISAPGIQGSVVLDDFAKAVAPADPEAGLRLATMLRDDLGRIDMSGERLLTLPSILAASSLLHIEHARKIEPGAFARFRDDVGLRAKESSGLLVLASAVLLIGMLSTALILPVVGLPMIAAATYLYSKAKK